MIHNLKLAFWEYRRSKSLISSVCHLLPFTKSGDFLWGCLVHLKNFGSFPKLKGDGRFSEHLLRIKFSKESGSTLRTRVSDKEYVKDYVREKLGEGFTPNTLAVLHSKPEASLYSYPDTCIVKPTHAAGKFILRINGLPKVDHAEVSSWFDTNYYHAAREANYRALQPKVIVEELIVEAGRAVPLDYKFFCFDGVPCFIAIQQDRLQGLKINYFSTNWKELNFCRVDYERSTNTIDKPQCLEKMLEIAKILATDFSFIRVDFYQINGKILIGELTNFPDACTSRFTPESADYAAGRLFDEPNLDIESLFGVR